MDEVRQSRLLDCLGEELGAAELSAAEIGSTIAFLLGLHLNEFDEWRFKWVDDLLDTRVEAVGKGVVQVLGSALWGERRRSAEWMDPLCCVITRNGDGTVIRYELAFRDDDQASAHYKGHRRHEPAREHNWSYQFAWERSNPG